MRSRKEKARLENYGLPAFLQRAYSWVFVFSESNQPTFRYELEGLERIARKQVLRLRFEGIPPYHQGINDWIGTAWIDPASFQILRVEAIPVKEFEQKRLMEKSLLAPGLTTMTYRGSYIFTTFTTEFDITKNGMRFPGRVVIRRSKYEVRGRRGRGKVREVPLFDITQTYERYKFFGVRTSEQIGLIIND